MIYSLPSYQYARFQFQSFVALIMASFVALSAAFSEQMTLLNSWSCPALGPRPPAKTIRELHPQDIRVVSCLGDSATSGCFAENKLQEARDISATCGGRAGALTLPNLLRHFQPAIVGFSMGTHALEVTGSWHQPSVDRCNAAQSGATSADVIPNQIEYLVEQLKALKNVSFANDWKMLNLWIGSNDLCALIPVAEYEKHCDQILAQIHAKIPRVFVNVLTMMNLSYIAHYSTDWCKAEHSVFAECKWIFTSTDQQLRRLEQYSDQYNEVLKRLAAKYNSLDDQSAFVMQPVFTKFNVPSRDWLSGIDCFHPTQIGHASSATCLWNNLFLPLGKKVEGCLTLPPLFCPTDDTSLIYS